MKYNIMLYYHMQHLDEIWFFFPETAIIIKKGNKIK